MTDDVLRGFERFAVAVRQRLEMGADAYSDRPAAVRPMPELVDELMCEAADLAGWGACLWTRLESLRSRLAALEATAEPRPTPVAPVARMVGAGRGTGGSDR